MQDNISKNAKGNGVTKHAAQQKIRRQANKHIKEYKQQLYYFTHLAFPFPFLYFFWLRKVEMLPILTLVNSKIKDMI
jgi:hypothetical protein